MQAHHLSDNEGCKRYVQYNPGASLQYKIKPMKFPRSKLLRYPGPAGVTEANLLHNSGCHDLTPASNYSPRSHSLTPSWWGRGENQKGESENTHGLR